MRRGMSWEWRRELRRGLIGVVGPTATGKSALAIALAERLRSPILNADSRQIYRELDIGTAKPTRAQRDRVPHYLLDRCAPTDTLTLAVYQQWANALIQACHRETGDRGSSLANHESPLEPAPWPLLVGGTGLYLKSVIRGLKIPQVPPQPALRSQLQTLDPAVRYACLRQVDPETAIHPNDQTRIIRALEVFYATGRSLSAQTGAAPPPYPVIQIGLDCFAPGELTATGAIAPREQPTRRSRRDPNQPDRLGDRIARRTAAMLAEGLVAETEGLMDRYGADLPLLNTLGYAEIRDSLQGRLSLAEAEAAIALHTRQFAKRQRTWFRADPTITWFDADDPNLIERVWDWLGDRLGWDGSGDPVLTDGG